MECTNLVGPITCCATGLLSYSYYFAYIPSTICSQDRLSTNAEVDLTRIILRPLSALSLDCNDQRERNITTGLFGLTYHVIKKDISFCFFFFFLSLRNAKEMHSVCQIWSFKNTLESERIQNRPPLLLTIVQYA